ncbi:MAG: type III-B CRISPR module RAMP protein Cmr6 [Lachnospiraceae bacterium]|nr:type III-B CRISPR module RAMP protein Cmr6 [Lachnospiraceae bacterium]
MNYDKILLPEYLKTALGNTHYNNGYMMFHRMLYGCPAEHDEDSKEISKYDEGSKEISKHPDYLKNFPFHAEINDVMKTSYKKDSLVKKHVDERNRLLSQAFGERYISIKAKVEGAIVVGMGQQSVSENSMLIHPIYGIPYIPGQSIKGMLRSFYINEFYDESEENAEKDEAFAFIFGRSERTEKNGSTLKGKKGNVCFYDAFPENNSFELSCDIITPHNSFYYQQGKAISDTENPIPVKFNVLRNAVFLISYSLPRNLPEDKNLIDAVNGIISQIEAALTYYGLGAKTSVGYGKFKPLSYTRGEHKVSFKSIPKPSKPILKVEKDQWYTVIVTGVNEDKRYLEVTVEGTSLAGRIPANILKHPKKQSMSNHSLYKNKGTPVRVRCYDYYHGDENIPLFSNK